MIRWGICAAGNIAGFVRVDEATSAKRHKTMVLMQKWHVAGELGSAALICCGPGRNSLTIVAG